MRFPSRTGAHRQCCTKSWSICVPFASSPAAQPRIRADAGQAGSLRPRCAARLNATLGPTGPPLHDDYTRIANHAFCNIIGRWISLPLRACEIYSRSICILITCLSLSSPLRNLANQTLHRFVPNTQASTSAPMTMSASKSSPSASIEPTELDKALRNAAAIVQEAVAEFRKEVGRLQRQLVKEQIAHESERAALLARLDHNAVASAPLLEELNRLYHEHAPRIKELRAKAGQRVA